MSEMSVLEASGYVTPDWAIHRPEVAQGTINELRLQSRALRREVHFSVYAPARADETRRYPLLVAHDGGELLEYSSFGVVLDNLMHRGMMADSFVALLHPKDRMREYAANAAHARFVNTELLPNLEQTLPLRRHPDARVLLGASLGAVASLDTAVRAPGYWGGLLLESGSFRDNIGGWSGAPAAIQRTSRFVRSLLRRRRPAARRIFQTYGMFEPLVEANREFSRVLRGMSDELHVFEALDGHSWTNWRDRMADGLGWLLPREDTGIAELRAS
ncbi:MAG: alpha/beta hydrolase [Candidatus Dormibacteria bacterium]